MNRFRDKLPAGSDLRNRIGGADRQRPGQRRRISRREREAKRRRQLFIGFSVAAAAVVAIIVAGLLSEYVIKPRAVLAEVGDNEINRREYWQYSSVQLYTQARQYEQFATMTQGDQQAQFLSFAASFDAQRRDIWGNTDVEAGTVQQMIDDQLFLQGAEELGLPITDEEIDAFILNQWAPPESPLVTPTPEPTLIPQRAIWATETAVAQLPQPPGTPAATPVAGTPVQAGATPIASIGPSPAASPDTGTPAATPDLSEARADATGNYEDFTEAVFDDARMSREDYIRLVVRPQIARQKVQDALYAEVGQTAEQVHAAHILVGTEELANQLYEQVQSGASFEELARVNSTDTATAPTGGDLGWFTRSEMVAPFAEAAFSTPPGEISEPVQTQFGWHVINILGHEDERALTDAQLNTVRTQAVEDWLTERRAQVDVDTEYEPTPTPTPAQFQPPAAAPTPIMATPVASPEASPGATPIAPVIATPPASPPAATPVA